MDGRDHRRARRWLAAVVATASGLVLPLAAASPASAGGCTKTWEGGTGNWTDSTTWTPDGSPGASDSVCIPTGDVSVRGNQSAASVDVSSGAALRIIGNPSAGSVTLTLSSASTNAGTIELTSEGGGYWATLTGGSLANSGSLVAGPGAGGNRVLDTTIANTGTWTITGTATVNGSTADTSSGAVNVNASGSLTFSGTSSLTQTAGSTVVDGGMLFQSGTTYTFGGGTTSGLGMAEIRSGTLAFSPSTTTAGASFRLTSLPTLTGNVPANASVTVEGNSTVGNTTLTLSGAIANAGSMAFTSSGGGYWASVTGGSLSSSGTIATNPGGGGERHLDSPLTNTGTMTIASTTVVGADVDDTNSGTINITSGSFTFASASNASFTQAAGTLTADAPMLMLPSTTFTLSGGAVNGTSGGPEIRSAALAFAPAAATPGASFRTTGVSTLSGDVPTNTSILIQGNPTTGNATLTAAAAWSNRGTVEMSSSGGGYSEALAGGTLTNRGTVRTTIGNGGQRYLNAKIVNLATVSIIADTYIAEKVTDVNRGAWTVDPAGAFTVFKRGAGFTQESGTFTIDGPVLFRPITNFTVSGGNMPTGDPVLLNTSLEFTTGASMSGAGSGAVVTGSSGRLRGTIPASFTLTVRGQGAYGNASMRLIGAVANNGTLAMTSSDGGYHAALTGTPLTNNGTVDTQPGTGGNRYLNVDITNNGTIAVNTSTFVTIAVDQVNAGSVAVAAGGSLNYSAGSSLTQQAGTLSATGGVSFASSTTLHVVGGAVTGTGTRVNSATLHFPVGAAVSAPSFITTAGSSVLDGDVPTSVTVTVEGNGSNGHATLTSGVGFVNRGTIVMTSSGGGYSSTVAAPTLDNRGVIRALGGAGGTRTLSSDVTNRGTIDLSVDQVGLGVTGTFNQLASGDLRVKVTGNGSASSLGVSGTATLAGTLKLTVTYTPSSGNSATVLTSTGGVSGTCTLNAPAGWSATYNPNNVVVSFT